MQIKFKTDIGQRRSSNQDAVAVFVNQAAIQLALVADGMGGHKAGDVASQLTIADVGESWEQTNLVEAEEIIQWLLRTIQHENEKIYAKGQHNTAQTGMGTTLVAVVVFETEAIIAHVGDSRCYLARQGKLKQLTEDHSLVNELVKSGEITPEMAIHHPRKNVLIRSIGIPGTVEVDVTTLEILAGDQLVLCSDGLTNMLSDQEILHIIEQPESLGKRLTDLVTAANAAGGTDNITVLVIDYSEKDEVPAND